MKEYLNAQNKMNESIIENVFSSDELHRFSKSDSRWVENRRKFLVKSSEFPFISLDSLLKLNTVCISHMQKIYALLPPNSPKTLFYACYQSTYISLISE